jgi:hypothetical protein
MNDFISVGRREPYCSYIASEQEQERVVAYAVGFLNWEANASAGALVLFHIGCGPNSSLDIGCL